MVCYGLYGEAGLLLLLLFVLLQRLFFLFLCLSCSLSHSEREEVYSLSLCSSFLLSAPFVDFLQWKKEGAGNTQEEEEEERARSWFWLSEDETEVYVKAGTEKTDKKTMGAGVEGKENQTDCKGVKTFTCCSSLEVSLSKKDFSKGRKKRKRKRFCEEALDLFSLSLSG